MGEGNNTTDEMLTNSRSTHDRYTEAYVNILDTYKDNLSEAMANKSTLKKNFLNFIKVIMYILVITFGLVVVLSLVIMGLMALQNINSMQVLTGAIVSIASSFASMLLGIWKLPKIIADYLFNKEEDQLMKEIIENIQKYELTADRAEKMRNQASVDAAMSTILTHTNASSEMHNSSYVDIEEMSNTQEEIA